MICKAFRDISITLPVDGSQDSKLAMKGIDFADISIGDGGKDPTTTELGQFLAEDSFSADNLRVWERDHRCINTLALENYRRDSSYSLALSRYIYMYWAHSIT